MAMLPVFPIRLILIILPVVAAGGALIVVAATDRGMKAFGRQGVAWLITSLMVAAAIGIGYAKAPANDTPVPDTAPTIPPAVASDIPQQGPVAFPSYVRDDAGVLSDRTVRELYERNLRLYETCGAAIGVVTCNYGRDDLYSYAFRQAEEMGLTGRDFIVALDISGDNYWLIQGTDLVDDFTDEDCGDYAWDYMEDSFAAGDYDGAVLDLTEMLELWYGTRFG